MLSMLALAKLSYILIVRHNVMLASLILSVRGGGCQSHLAQQTHAPTIARLNIEVKIVMTSLREHISQNKSALQ